MRISFLAMSGIRACDPELLALGLTLPGVLERSKVVAALPSLGLLTLAGVTPRDCTPVYTLGDSSVSSAISGRVSSGRQRSMRRASRSTIQYSATPAR